jgi:protein-L-isoaspartate(D-aspartate) O-methyltransferase
MAADKARLIGHLARRIRDERVLAALAAVPREEFVPPDLRAQAWENTSLPIAAGQTISQPYVVARMCELLALRGDETVLDVGTGSGYHAAVLDVLSARVVSIERHASLSHAAAEALARAGARNVTLVVGDGAQGHPPEAPYGAINVAAGTARGVPAALVDQLADGGRLVIPTGAAQRLVLIRRRGDRLERERHDPVRFVPLVTEAGVS